jgi:Golgi apyrase
LFGNPRPRRLRWASVCNPLGRLPPPASVPSTDRSDRAGRYGVILDAGSSGTRVHIYRWLKSDTARKSASEAQLHKLPDIETDKKWTKKIHPGISTFGEHPHDVGPEHLNELLTHALRHVPLDEVPNTPLFLLATAGMRILPSVQRQSVLKEVCDFAQKTTQFQLPDCGLHVQVIPGETEGLYGWIAANYLLGGFDNPEGHEHGNGHHTYGFLDMGGASAQIAFAPNATEADKHSNDLTLLRLRSIDGGPLEYKVFVTTWLGFGVNQARERYVKALLASSPGAKEYPDPCLPAGAKLTVSKDGKVIQDKKASGQPLIGIGIFSECIHQTYPLLEKEKECLDSPCLINGQHTPAIDFDVNHFVGVSEYYHTTHEIFEMAHRDDDGYDFESYQKAVDEFCSKSWKDIEKGINGKKWGKKVDEETALEVCFKSSWLINVLHDGIGVPRVGIENLDSAHNITKAKVGGGKKKDFLNPFQAVNKINDVELSWTLGKMILYASSEIPALSTEALAVGFGSNKPGLPDDFQYPGGTYSPYSGVDDGRHNGIFSENPRRIPGFLIFVLIIFVVGYLTCGRERRKTVRQKVARMFGRGSKHSSLRRRRGFAGKLFGLGSTPSYDRILEDGEAVNDFELASYSDASDNDHSDSSEGTRIGRTSGWATPQIKAGMAEPGTPSGYMEAGRDVMAQGAGLGLGPPGSFSKSIERGGLMARTDSRERLAGGRFSRASSPRRLKTPMSKLDE